jgi:hypothetical protein
VNYAPLPIVTTRYARVRDAVPQIQPHMGILRDPRAVKAHKRPVRFGREIVYYSHELIVFGYPPQNGSPTNTVVAASEPDPEDAYAGTTQRIRTDGGISGFTRKISNR